MNVHETYMNVDPVLTENATFFIMDTTIVHRYTVKAMTENATFRKRSTEFMDIFENDTVACSCGRGRGTFR